MNTGCSQHRETLAALARGALDTVAPRTVELFEQHLNECPRCAAALAGVRAVDDADADGLLSGAANSAAPLRPRDAEAIWRGVSNRGAHAVRGSLFRRRLRMVSPLAMAAACVLMVNLWQRTRPPEPRAWEFETASWVEVDGVEVFDDHSGIFVSSGGDDVLPFIWVIDENGDES